ncbi:MAG: hypothetical protein IPN68_14440 [Bacteroidetes bacterium]|nr:hypothetical protein [Bacteroidota bacterium]
MRLLVIRTSAMGDVAFTTPVIAGIRKQYPDVELVILTRAAFKSFFSEDTGLKLFSLILREGTKDSQVSFACLQTFRNRGNLIMS